jgi:hypothetical protein
MRLIGGCITVAGFAMYLVAVLLPGRVKVRRGASFVPAE